MALLLPARLAVEIVANIALLFGVVNCLYASI